METSAPTVGYQAVDYSEEGDARDVVFSAWPTCTS